MRCNEIERKPTRRAGQDHDWVNVEEQVEQSCRDHRDRRPLQNYHSPKSSVGAARSSEPGARMPWSGRVETLLTHELG